MTDEKVPLTYRFALELMSWVGISLILAGFTLVSFSHIPPDGLLYPLFNGIGSLLLVFTSWYKKFIQLVILNIVWFVISSVAIARVLFW